MKKPLVLVILGQTATGKSALGVKVAKLLGGEIISADSRQVYKGLNIGTAKISKRKMRGVPHHLLDVVNPKTKFSVFDYKKLANIAIEKVLEKNRLPIICGGTGFYIDSIVKEIIFPNVPPDERFRKKIQSKSSKELFEYLKKLDKERAKSIDPNNKKRLIRAIEIVLYLGKVPKLVKAQPLYKFIKVGLYLPKDDLKSEVKKRVARMFKMGLLREVSKLKKMGISENRLRELGFEYYNPTPESVLTGTLKYAKRQMTWFKRDKQVKWFKAHEQEKILGFLSKHLNNNR